MKLVACDCSPFDPQPTEAEAVWLRKLTTHFRASDLVVPISGKRKEDEPIVYCDWDGSWWAGRYVGSISFEGHTLTITPRFGLNTLRDWLSEVSSVVLTDVSGELKEDESFIVQLLASVWVHGFMEAARHGLPALRREIATKGTAVRGRLDVPASIRLIATGSKQVISISSERSLNHVASAAIVSAYAVFRQWIGGQEEKWLSTRAKELLLHLIAATGARPRVPTKAELERVRYTPITASFAPIAELSRRIAGRKGITADVGVNDEAKGMMLDIAELWEMYVLSVLRKAAVPLTVTHGTKEGAENKQLLKSDVSGQGLGTLAPDAILLSGTTVTGVFDAKYKSLHPSSRSIHGPQRDDLYQMSAYLGRFKASAGQKILGGLVYPFDPLKPDTPKAEQNSPWSLENEKKIVFVTLPHNSKEAVSKLRKIITQAISVG